MRTMARDRIWFDSGKCFIDGNWVLPRSGEYLPLENPSTGEEIGKIARGRKQDIDDAVTAAQGARQGPWARMTATERGCILTRLGQLVQARIDDLAAIEAMDVGKPLKQ